MLKTKHPAFNTNRHSSQKRTSKQDDVPCWRKTKQMPLRGSQCTLDQNRQHGIAVIDLFDVISCIAAVVAAVELSVVN